VSIHLEMSHFMIDRCSHRKLSREIVALAFIMMNKKHLSYILAVLVIGITVNILTAQVIGLDVIHRNHDNILKAYHHYYPQP